MIFVALTAALPPSDLDLPKIGAFTVRSARVFTRPASSRMEIGGDFAPLGVPPASVAKTPAGWAYRDGRMEIAVRGDAFTAVWRRGSEIGEGALRLDLSRALAGGRLIAIVDFEGGTAFVKFGSSSEAAAALARADGLWARPQRPDFRMTSCLGTVVSILRPKKSGDARYDDTILSPSVNFESDTTDDQAAKRLRSLSGLAGR